jgi:hypothetical protein
MSASEDTQRLTPWRTADSRTFMSAAQIIEAIKKLPPEERLEVVRFAREYETVPKLTPEQLAHLGQRLAEATDPAEIAQLEKALLNGFYGMKIDA